MTRQEEKDFAYYIATQTPLPWTIVREHPNLRLSGNEAMAINYARLKLITGIIKDYFQDNWIIADIGVYPGIIPKIFKEFFPKERPYEYYGCGLGFDGEFRKTMQDFKVRLLECDLDPRLHLHQGRATKIPLQENFTDFCIFTDTIEHFFDPFYALKEINRVCKIGGILLLTTDNLTRIDSVLATLKGRSSGVPLIESSLFYEGDWRPHFREYSRGEIYQLLKWSGFEVLEHNFYEAEFGLYKVIESKLVNTTARKIRDKRILRNLTGAIFKKLFPCFKDNQILVAKKTISYHDILNHSPKLLNNLDEWISQRKQLSQ